LSLLSDIELPPEDASEDLWLRCCARLSAQGDQGRLLAALNAAVLARPQSAKLLFNQGVLLHRLDQVEQACAAWLAVIAIDATHGKAHKALAQVALADKDGPLARHHATLAVKALDTTPSEYALATLCVLGKALVICGDWDDALVAFGQAQSIASQLGQTSDDAMLGWHLSRLLTSRGHINADELRTWRHAQWLSDASAGLRDDSPSWDLPTQIDLEVQALSLVADMGIARLRACDWRERDTVVRIMRRLAERVCLDPGLCTPKQAAFEALHLGLSPKELQWLARGATNLARSFQHPRPLPAAPARPDPDGRIRLAYLSNDYGNHPTTQLIHRVLAHHDRTRFEVFAYALNKDDESVARQRVHQQVDHFVEVVDRDARSVAERIQADGIDVLIGLGGHTTGAVLDVALWRPAPMQVNYLSFCGTTGAPDAFDVHIGDPVALPADLAACYDERVAYLPKGHYTYDDSRVLGPVPSRQSVGLPENQLVLCGFNNSYKIEPGVFDAWCNILRRVPESILWLFQVHRDQPEHLWAEAARRGIEPTRLRFAQPLAGEGYLDRLGCADLFLDTFEYNGHTSMLDVLYAGVPAITRCGLTSAGRIASSFLHEAELGELVAHDTAHYVDLAVALASDPARRAHIAQHLADLRTRRAAPFGSESRCRELETLYATLHRAPCEMGLDCPPHLRPHGH
jgi:predicted O-linked N-acetylglucosamine transferase (SPINDLY family)